MAKAWTNGDNELIRRLTSSSRRQQLRQWLNEHRSPLPAEALNQASNLKQTHVEVKVLQRTQDEAQLAMNVSHPLTQSATLVQYWMKEGETWYFVPQSDMEIRLQRAPQQQTPRRRR